MAVKPWSFTFALILIYSMNISCFAQESELDEIAQLRNPFESWPRIIEKRKEAAKSQEGESQILPKMAEFKLTGILQGRWNLAIINGEVVGEGDVIEGKKVVQISKKMVILNGEADKITLEIKDEF